MYMGVYNGSKRHEPDLSQVLKRAWEAGLQKIIVTGGNLEESKKALEIAQTDGLKFRKAFKLIFLIFFRKII